MVGVNMASLKSLSDDDLRQKLEIYGITSPVTATTRDIMMKKLNHAIANQKKMGVVNKTLSRSSHRLHTLSSDEDEDDSSTVSSSRRWSRRSKRDGVRSAAETPVSDRNGAAYGYASSNSSSALRGKFSKHSSSSQVTEGVPNMASLKSLSDDDLRKQLLMHGITSPVTSTTRDIVIKKLHHAIVSQKKVGAVRQSPVRSSHKLHTFSSDEDDDESSSYSSGRYSSQGRDRVGGLRSSDDFNSSGGYSSRNSSYNEDEPAARRTRVSSGTYFPAGAKVAAKSGVSPRAKIHDDYETGSDSDLAEGDGVHYMSSGAATTARGVYNNRSRENSVLSDNSSFNGSARAFYQNHKSGVSSPLDRLGPVEGDSVKSRKGRYTFLENGRRHEEECSEDHDYSNISFNGSAESIVTQTSPGANHEPMRVANGRHHSESNSPEDPSPGDESTWHYSIPLLLLVLLAIFFSVLAMLYVNMRLPLLPMLQSVPAVFYQVMAKLPVPFLARTDPERLNQTAETGAPASLPIPTGSPPLLSQKQESRFPICSKDVTTACLTRPEMSAFQVIASRLEDVLIPALHQQEGLFQCGESSVRYMSTADLQALLHHTQVISENASSDSIVALGKLAELNQPWGLKSVREGDALLGISLSAPPTHIVCHIKATLRSLFHIIVGVFLAVGTCCLTFTWFKYHRHKKELEKQQVFEMVEQILEILGGLVGPSGKDYVAVNHVRDSIIGPRDRKMKKDIWKKAVAFIDNHESRICREIQSVGGEDCVIWRWTSGVPHSPSKAAGLDGIGGRPPAKMWQGQAFESLETTHNLPNVSPTSCLKIRNMFDCDVEFGDNWPSRIQDSILEKCEGISIVHVAVDRGSREGCVYLKCASLGEAGRAFRALHGWWYDGNLVTVKFLRDERYHQRFPSAFHATRRLRPSNNKRLSLQVPAGESDSVEHP